MLKTRTCIIGLALASLALAPATASDTRSSAPPAQSGQRGGPALSEDRRELVLDIAAESCDAPGNGQKTGHETSNGKGHEIGRGKGHACDSKSPG